MQAIILAAGMGKRLKGLTSSVTKCMVRVNGVTMIERSLRELDACGLSRIVLVVGYEGRKLMDYVRTLGISTPIEFVENEVYDRTNNIYSLYLARGYLQREDTLLLESDIVYEPKVLRRILEDPYPSLALVDRFESWMDGTVVTLDGENNILSFLGKKDFRFQDIPDYYKTVNIYKFSREFSCTHYVPFLEAYCKALGRNEYYEQVLKVITLLERPGIRALPLDGEQWYEIDDLQDLDIAESMFADREERARRLSSRFGGYWRYPHLTDFCYLVNPCYPDARLMDEIKANFEQLLCAYPSGMRVNSLLAAKYWGIRQEQVVVGNGAAELIKALMERCTGKLGVIFPTFEEYPHRRGDAEIVPFLAPAEKNFAYTADDLIAFFDRREIAALALVNPDNPSGNFLPMDGLKRLISWADRKGIQLIIDESFADFAEADCRVSLLDEELLDAHPRLVVVKSISKSFGVPGLRLGVLASGDAELIAALRQNVAIWNINSFGEFFLQIFEKYASSYREALERFCRLRSNFVVALGGIPGLEVFPSQANYVMCRLPAPFHADQLVAELLDEGFLLKNLSGKRGIVGTGEYLRIAVRGAEDNARLTAALSRKLTV